MGLLINQGTQDTTQDNKFNPIVAPNVLLEVTELKLAQTQASTLEITFRVLEGQYKNKSVFDRVIFDPKSNMSWKYRQLRKCAGVPYQEGEPATIDIEALLLHKAVKADLGIRKGKNKDGVEQDYQDIKYKAMPNSNNQVATPVAPQPSIGSVFSQPTPQPTPAPASKKTSKPKAVKEEETPAEENTVTTNPQNFEEEVVDEVNQIESNSSITIDDDEDWG